MQLGCRQDSLNETFWLMAFLESASCIGSQVLANWMVTSNVKSSIGLPSLGVVLLATVCAFYIVKGWKGAPQVASFKDYKMSFYACIFYGKFYKVLVSHTEKEGGRRGGEEGWGLW